MKKFILTSLIALSSLSAAAAVCTEELGQAKNNWPQFKSIYSRYQKTSLKGNVIARSNSKMLVDYQSSPISNEMVAKVKDDANQFDADLNELYHLGINYTNTAPQVAFELDSCVNHNRPTCKIELRDFVRHEYDSVYAYQKLMKTAEDARWTYIDLSKAMEGSLNGNRRLPENEVKTSMSAAANYYSEGRDMMPWWDAHQVMRPKIETELAKCLE